MKRYAPMLRRLALLSSALLGACGREQPGNPAQTASTYTSDADSDATQNARQGTRQGRTFEALPKIPGVRVQLGQLQSGRPAPENLTAYKFAVADLVSSMEADLIRLGAADHAARIRQAGDSLGDVFGGGTGGAEKLPRETVRAHAQAVERLIKEYEGIVSRRGS
jgi:hypothetical protein